MQRISERLDVLTKQKKAVRAHVSMLPKDVMDAPLPPLPTEMLDIDIDAELDERVKRPRMGSM